MALGGGTKSLVYACREVSSKAFPFGLQYPELLKALFGVKTATATGYLDALFDPMRKQHGTIRVMKFVFISISELVF